MKKFSALLLLLACYFLVYTPAYSQTSHERTLENFNQALTPFKEVDLTPKSFFENIIIKLKDYLNTFLGFQPNSLETFTSRVELQSKTDLPASAASQDENIIKKTGENLGSSASSGIFNSLIPREVQQDIGKGCEVDKLYDQANYPQGIDPTSESGCKSL